MSAVGHETDVATPRPLLREKQTSSRTCQPSIRRFFLRGDIRWKSCRVTAQKICKCASNENSLGAVMPVCHVETRRRGNIQRRGEGRLEKWQSHFHDDSCR